MISCRRNGEIFTTDNAERREDIGNPGKTLAAQARGDLFFHDTTGAASWRKKQLGQQVYPFMKLFLAGHHLSMLYRIRIAQRFIADLHDSKISSLRNNLKPL